uniref:Uncharacterized protein n=1 Tax=Oryzias latipes TaxID=8090 RepID=A0A3P9K2R0_ORYLA
IHPECHIHAWTIREEGNVYLDASRSAFPNSIRDSSTRRVNHGHEANKAKVARLEVHIICVKGKTLGILVLWQENVAETWKEVTSNFALMWEFYIGCRQKFNLNFPSFALNYE